jgi:hypothetical protein
MLRTKNELILPKIRRIRLQLCVIPYLTCPLPSTRLFWLHITYNSPIKGSEPLPYFDLVEVKIQRELIPSLRNSSIILYHSSHMVDI